MTQRDKEKFMEEIGEIFNEVRNGVIDVINGIAQPESLTPILKKWHAKRQLFNNQNIGILFNQRAITIFSITGNPKLDMGQKALSVQPKITESEIQFDKEFLKKIGIVSEPKS